MKVFSSYHTPIQVIGLALLAAGLLACSTPVENPGGDFALLEGDVADVTTRWTEDRRFIISEAKVRLYDGSIATVHQFGGTVKDITMTMSHYPPPLEAGEYVRATAALTQSNTYDLRQVLVRAPATVAADTPVARYGVKRTTRTGKPLYWPSGCIHQVYDSAGTSQLAGDVELQLLDAAAASWVVETELCSELSFTSAQGENLEPGRNQVNTVIWREDRWCRPATDTEPELCFNPDAIAVTQTFFVDDPDSPRDGEIVEADIELNAVNFAFTVNGQTLGSALRTADLSSTVTHELGHLLGLDHNCWDGVGRVPTDHQGNPVPDCSAIDGDSEFTEATMYYLQSPDETKKASLETSDVLGICVGLAGVECSRVVRGGCEIAPGRGRFGAGGGFAILILLAILYRTVARRSAASGRDDSIGA